MPPAVDFAAFPYFPCLQCSPGELLGYQMLSDSDKDAILPIFEISYLPRMPMETSVDAIRDVIADRRFILDLCHEPAPSPYVAKKPKDIEKDNRRVQEQQEYKAAYDKDLSSLLDSRNGFEKWRAVVRSFANAVPVLQFNDLEAEQRQILRQASLLLAGGGSIAIRVRIEEVDVAIPVIAQIISTLEDARRVLLIIDCGQGRQKIAERASAASDAILKIRDEIDLSQRSSLIAVCLSNSFTQPQPPFPRDYENKEPELWEAASEAFPFLLGDYAATFRRVSTTTYVPDEWVASVVFPLDNSWLVYKHNNQKDPKGWVDGSKVIVGDKAKYSPLPGVWGDSLIGNASKGKISGVDKARFWHAAKVNIHIHRQVCAAPGRLAEYASVEDED